MTGKIVLVEEGANPSSDYFLVPAFRAAGADIVRLGHDDTADDSALNGTTLVFVRYVPSAWMHRVEGARHLLKRLVFFMDDDVLDLSASVGMPLRYRWKLARLAALRRGWLRQQRAELWVSSPYLKEKYASWGAKLLLPSPMKAGIAQRRFFYHGSASHRAEIRWLRPVVEEVLRSNDDAAFEIVGGQDVFRTYKNLPRLTVIHPMKWEAYQATLGATGRDVGLVPQLDVPFNRARSYTKFFDITRCGAVGVYSSGSACASIITPGVEGLVARLDPDEWVGKISSLLRDDGLRAQLLSGAKRRVEELDREAREASASLL